MTVEPYDMQRRRRDEACRCAAEGRGASVTCSVCGAIHSSAAFDALPLVDRIEAPAIRQFVRPWPDEARIDVRRCASCGHTIAVKRTSRHA